jgi:hypothetical protein
VSVHPSVCLCLSICLAVKMLRQDKYRDKGVGDDWTVGKE